MRFLCDFCAMQAGAREKQDLLRPGRSTRFVPKLIRALDRRLYDANAVRVASFGDRFPLSPSWVSGFGATWKAFVEV